MKPRTLITIVVLAAVPAVGLALTKVMDWSTAAAESHDLQVARNSNTVSMIDPISPDRSRPGRVITAATTNTTKLYEAAMAKMHHAMAIAYTGDPDVDFARSMIPHHQGAIDMAKVVLEHGQDPEIRKLAEEIIKAQEGEIAWLKEWLAKKGQ